MPSPFRIHNERIVGRSRVYCVYGYDPAQGSGRRDDAIEVFDNASPPSVTVRMLLRRNAGVLGAAWMRRRMVKYGAVLLVMVRGNGMESTGSCRRMISPQELMIKRRPSGNAVCSAERTTTNGALTEESRHDQR